VCVDKAVERTAMQAQGDDYSDNSKAAFEEFVAELKAVRCAFSKLYC
jgi:hypothetical protein